MIVLNIVAVHGSIVFVLIKVDEIQSIFSFSKNKLEGKAMYSANILPSLLEGKCDLNFSGLFCFIKVT